MSEATVTSKGQITIPADVRRTLDLHAGSRVHFVPTDVGSYELVAVTHSVRALKGVVPPPDRPLTLSEMDDAIADAAAGST